MKLDSLPRDIEAPIRQAVEGLRAAVANHRPSEALEPSNAALLAAAKGLDRAMKQLAPLGFISLGDVGDRLEDGSLTVSRWFSHSDGTICGYAGFLSGQNGGHLLVFLMTEASGPSYCTTLRGATALSLARPPNVVAAHHDRTASLVTVVRGHRARVSALKAAGKRLTNVTTLGEALEFMERFHQNRVTWRASLDEHDLLRADVASVLEHLSREWGPKDLQRTFPRAAKWCDVQPGPSRAAPGDHSNLTPGPLAGSFSSTLTFPEAEQGTPGVESEWLFHSELKLQGTRLQMLDVFMAGNDDEGVILDVSPGVYIVEARVMTFGIDRRISRVRVYPKGQVVTLGELAGEVGVDLAAVAICDVDPLASWAQDHQGEWQAWGDKLWFGREARAGLYTCEPAKTVVAFVDSGFGDGTYPVYYLMHDGRPVGLEAEFLEPGTGYL